jgi:hypothetical protein
MDFLFFPIYKYPISLSFFVLSVSVPHASPYLTVGILLHVTTLYIWNILSLYHVRVLLEF